MDTKAVKWAKAKRWLRVIAANVAILLALAVLAELVFGSIFFGENYGVLVVDRNVSRRFDATERYGGGMTEYLRDHHGLRGQYSKQHPQHVGKHGRCLAPIYSQT